MADKEDKTTNKEKMEQISAMLENGVRDLFQTDKYKKYLNVMDKFSTYSINNQILIASQKPDATLVAGYQSWQKNFNRHVKKGEKGIRIIAPMPVQVKRQQEMKDEQGNTIMTEDGTKKMEEVNMTIPRFRAVTVFDISQTEGEPLPERPGAEMLTAKVNDYSTMMQALRKISPVPIRFDDDIEGTANGFYDSRKKEIVVRAGMPEAQTVKTLIHEVVHARLHDPDAPRKQGAGRVDQVTREIQAESVAYIICNHFGLDTSSYSFPYVAAWSSSIEMQELKESMDVIRRAAADIIDELTAQMDLNRSPEQEQALQDDMPKSSESSEKINYAIYQLSKSNAPYEFMGINFVNNHNLKVKAGDYSCVYSGSLTNIKEEVALDELYRIFNIDRPTDFKGHSLSVSDVVVLKCDGKERAYYVDSFGFKQLPDFMLELEQSQQDKMSKNIKCKQAIEKAINENYDHANGHLDTTKAVKSVIDEYGATCTNYVLAVTICMKNWDTRFSPDNRMWAEELTKNDVIETNELDLRNAFVVDSHPALLDGFVSRARMYTEIDRKPDQYRYYSTQRPIGPGTYPKPEGNTPIEIVNFDSDNLIPVEGENLQAWGYVEYEKPLTKEEYSNYELRPAKECQEQERQTDRAPEKSSVLDKLKKNQNRVSAMGRDPFEREGRGEICR